MKNGFGSGLVAAGVAALAAGLGGCGSGSSSSDTVTIEGDFPVVYVKRSADISIAPTNGAPFAAGGDLMLREKSSASAVEHNLTARFTLGVGDASDPEASYDGKKVVFAMRCPASNAATIGGQPACTGRWNIWEYDMTGTTLTTGVFRRLTSSTDTDDVDPVYLPAGAGFVFSSNRQTKSRTNQGIPGQTYFALDEYERERVFNLHTMDANGGNIQQITFNQSHDRNPIVESGGTILFARWEHLADRNRFAIFRVKPDGTDLFVRYGAQSPGNSFLHPREMDPSGPFSGFLSSSLMPLSRTQEGGGLLLIDAANYSENNTPSNASVPAEGGQKQATTTLINTGNGLSAFGRITSPFPLWDGTNRFLMGFRPCEVTRNGDVVPCATLTEAERLRLGDRQRLAAEAAADPLQDNAPAAYAIHMFDPAQQRHSIVAAPPPGFMLTDPIPLQERPEPTALQPTAVDAALAAQDKAEIEVRSVYDTDGLQRMSDPMLVSSDLPAGCTTSIAKTPPTEPGDTRPLVADLARLKDPADPAYRCAPARFVRVIRAVAPPSAVMGLRSAIGETEFEQQRILGYAPIEPDGSFKLQVPADVPLALSIIDAEGRAFQTHTNWIQVRPGERRTCDGCHSPRRGASLNSGAVVNTMPAALVAAKAAEHQSGETMAAQRFRVTKALDPNDPTLEPVPDMVFTDDWADTTQAGVTARSSITLRYTGNPDAADDLATPVPTDGLINYPDHIAPLWTRSRGAGGADTCTNCHNDPAVLDLRDTVAGTGRLTSYEELVVGDPLFTGNPPAPVIAIEDGVPVIQRGPALVETSSGAANTAGQARKSRLTEILFGQTLLAGENARNAHPNPPAGAPDHATLLNAAEKRLVAEWMDLGGQYYNNPFDSSAVRTIGTLSQSRFNDEVFPILRRSCAAGCHQAIGTDPDVPAGTQFRSNRFVLTGDPEGDFGVTLSMISDACNAGSNFLLTRPSTVPHPLGATDQTTAVLPVGSADYNTIEAWITTGCP